MALFKILRGPSNSIQDEKKVPLRDGYAYFTPDKGNFYIDARTDESNAASVKRIWINPPVAEFDSSEWGKAANDRISIADKYINYIKPPVVDPANHRMTIYDGEGVGKNVAMNFVNRSGDTMTGDLNFANITDGKREIRFTVGDNDFARIAGGATGTNNGYLEIATADDAKEPIYVRQYHGVFNTSARTLTLLDSSGNTTIPGGLTVVGDITAPKFHGTVDYATYDTTERGKTNKQDIANKYIHTITTKVDATNKKLISTYGDGTTAQIDLENLEQIGGRNLLRNSAITKENLRYWIAGGTATKSIENVDGENCLKIVSTGNEGVHGDMNAGINNLYPGKIYTYSFWIKSNVAKSFNHLSIGHYQTVISGNAHVSANKSSYPDTIPANTWTKAICRFTVSSQCYFVPYIWYLGNGTTVWVRDIKLEEGNEATDWTPAPEDLAYLNSSPTFTGDLKAASLTATKDVTAPAFHGTADYAKYDTVEKGKGSNAQEIPTKYMSYSTPPVVNPASHTITIHNGEGGSKTIAANFVNRAGDTMTGALNFANGTWNTVGDDVQIGDINRSGTLGVRGKNGTTAIQLVPAGGTMSESNATWSSSAAGASTISGNVAFGGNVTPTTGAKYSLGNSSLRWSNVYTEEMNATNLYASEGIGNDNFILHPGGGEYSSKSGSVTGALVIKLPLAKPTTMITMEVHIYNGVSNTSIIYYISGYHQNDATWLNPTAYTNANAINAKGNLTVRFGADANGYGLISIGETDTKWIYPQVSISNVIIGYGNTNFSKWKTGWNISFSTTAITNISKTTTDTTSTLLPYGFTSYTSNATWGNQIGSTITNWSTNGGSIDFRKDNPSNGKLSIKVNGRVYVNEGLNPVMGMTQGQDNFWGMGTPDGDANAFIRTTSSGIIPYQSGGPNAGHNSLGTSGWYFGDVFSTRLNSQWVHADMATNGADGGLTLWGGSPFYGIMFRPTSNQGKHGYVTNDYATYFTMDGTANRGWIFKKWGAEAVASINNAGYAQFNKINLNRHSGTNFGRISWYDPTYYTWNDYMSNPAAGAAPTGGQPSTLGNVTAWAKRSLIENISGYGWIWESAENAAAASSTTTPKAIMALSSVNGDLTMTGSIKNLPTGGGIYWNPHVESASDASDAASITQIKSGVAGGTELRIQQQNNADDVINLVAPYHIYLNGKRVFTINDSWLRINENLGFSSGIYTGSSLIRSDNQLQVGGSGNRFYANSSGDGFFSHTLGIAGTNTNYNLYVNGTSYFSDNISIKAGKEIKSVGTKATSSMIRFLDNTSDAFGNGISIGGGGVTVLGAGESASSLSASAGAETLYLLSDGSINIESNCDTISNRVGFQVNTSGHIIPVKAEAGTDNIQNIGATGNRWANIYATTFHGALDGNAVMATKANQLALQSTVSTGNTAAQPWHRIMFIDAQSAAHRDNETTIYIRSAYNGGPNGMAKIALRGNNTGNPNLSITWLFKNGFASDDLRGGLYYGSSGAGYYADIYLKRGQWARTSIYTLTDSGGWNFLNTSENDGNASHSNCYTGTNARTYSTIISGNDDIVAGAATFNGPVYANRVDYSVPSFKWNKNGDHWGGIGYNGVRNENFFGACDANGNWVDINGSSTERWRFTGQLIVQSDTSDSAAYGSANPTITFMNVDKSQNCSLVFTNYDSVRYPAGITLIGNQGNEWFQAPRVFGAVWNDYAEYRKTDEIKPGQCVIETGKGDLVRSTARLQPGANIVSDTFGFAIGETENTKTPIAVSGRVLAYPYEDRDSYQAGDPVCSGPNGTISRMTREEVREYPDRIIGTVSEIPDYEVWGTGKVKVDGRIWIKVK